MCFPCNRSGCYRVWRFRVNTIDAPSRVDARSLNAVAAARKLARQARVALVARQARLALAAQQLRQDPPKDKTVGRVS